MTCEDIQAMWTDYLDHELSDISRYSFDLHIKSCEKCAKELQQLQFLVDQMADEKQIIPSEELPKKFNAMLQSELNLQSAQNILEKDVKAKIFRFNSASSIWKIAAACIILFAGILIGVLMKYPATNTSSRQLSEMKKDIKDMKETLMFSLLKDESASQRIKAVSYAEEMPHPDQKIIHALISTLNEDKNVNVRLAALYSMNKFSGDREVRDSLVQSLRKQTEPIIQIVLINMLMEKNETRAIQPIRDIISRANTMNEVKEIGKKALKEL